MNLGFRDAATLADCVSDALAAGGDPGGSAVTDRYSALRAPDVTGRINALDLLNRTLLSPYLPVHLMRGFGLHVLNTVTPLRRLLVKEGVQPRLTSGSHARRRLGTRSKPDKESRP